VGSSDDPREVQQPMGTMFECAGCKVWAHSTCMYSSDTVPLLAFCYRCHLVLLQVSKGGQGNPAVKGKNIKMKSRVVVMEGKTGIREVCRKA